MNDETTNPDKEQKRSWLERLGQALQGELKDRDQLIEVLHEAQRNAVIDYDALTMIEGVIGVSEMQVRDIMIPRAQMVVVERDADLKVILQTVVESAVVVPVQPYPAMYEPVTRFVEANSSQSP